MAGNDGRATRDTPRPLHRVARTLPLAGNNPQIFLFRDQVTAFRHPVEETNPLQMIEFVLKHAGEEVGAFLLPRGWLRSPLRQAC